MGVHQPLSAGQRLCEKHITVPVQIYACEGDLRVSSSCGWLAGLNKSEEAPGGDESCTGGKVDAAASTVATELPTKVQT